MRNRFLPLLLLLTVAAAPPANVPMQNGLPRAVVPSALIDGAGALLGVDSTHPIYITGGSGGSTASASVGANGSTAPTSSDEIGYIGADGFAHGVVGDNTGHPAFSIFGTPTFNVGATNGLALDTTAAAAFKAGQLIGNTTFAATGQGGTSYAQGAGVVDANTARVTVADNAAVAVTPQSALGTLFQADMSGYGGVGFQLTGTWAGTVAFQYSDDATTWYNAAAYSSAAGWVTSYTTNGAFFVPAQHRYFRAVVSVYTSGTFSAVAYLRALGVPVTQPSPALGASNQTIGNLLRSLFYNDSTAVLAASANFQGTARNVGAVAGSATSYGSFTCQFYSDQASATNGAHVEGSPTGSAPWYPEQQASLAAGGALTLTAHVTYQYQRCYLLNGGTAQTVNSISSNFGIGN